MSKKPPQQSLQTIDPTALSNVSGGASRTPSSSAASSTDDTLTALTGILDSLRSLADNQNRGGFGTNEMMLLMMMMNRQSQPTVVTTAPAASPWGPYGPWPY